ncbi:MAG TPA: amidohydrolase [Pirellulales bacterium]|nr:amidohydrolase [Pirellulales bacterium]
MCRAFVAAALALLFSITTLVQASEDPATWAGENVEKLVGLYKQLHQSPELSSEEKATSERIAAELKAAGVEVGPRLGGYGVVGLLSNGEGPRIMVRTDLDALPVTEQTGLTYASKVRVRDKQGREIGVMHACGHDVHMTCFVGVARYLAENKDRWRGTVMFVGQPAEEAGSGARRMLDDGLFEKYPKPECALALHCSALLPTGTVGYRPGYALANVDSVDITLYGKGGHGAYPHTTVDPIVEAAHLILDLQTIVSREIKPIEPAVITVGAIHGGTKHNIIGETCHLQLTVRSYSDEVRDQLRAAIRRKTKAVADSAGAPEPKIEFVEGAIALKNDEKLVERLVPVFQRTFGMDKVVLTEPSMGGEDFSQYGIDGGIPVFQMQIGTVEPERLAGYKRLHHSPPSLHSPQYYPDAQDAIATGVTAMGVAVLDLLAPMP